MNTSTNLTVEDIDFMRQVIERAVKFGAFEARELSSVGVLYDKLIVVLDQYQASVQSKGESQ